MQRLPHLLSTGLRAAIAVGIMLAVSFFLITRFNLPLFNRLTNDFDLWPWNHVGVEPDPFLQRRLIPNSSFRVKTVDLYFTFTTDDKGRRITPPTVRPDLPVLGFFGASFTFGLNVNDQETFPYIVGTRLNEKFRVENYASIGWTGIENRYRLKSVLQNNESPRLTHVFLDWLPSSSELMEPYVSEFTRAKKKDKAHRLEEEVFLDFRNLCRAHNIRFTALILGKHLSWNKPLGPYGRMKAFFERNGIEYLDLSDIDAFDRGTVFDTHPGPSWHAKVAERIVAYINTRGPAQ